MNGPIGMNEPIAAVIVGLLLSLSAGVRITLPLLGVNLLAFYHEITLPDNMTWLGTEPTLIILSVACAAETLVHFIPAAGTWIKAMATPLAFVAGTLLMAVPLGDDMAKPPVSPAPPDLSQTPPAPPDLTAPADFASSSSGCTAHLVINEVKVAGTSNVDDEFIEIFNPCPTPVSLVNWTLGHYAATGTTANVIATLTGNISGNGYYLIAESSCACSTIADVTYSSGSLAAAGGGVGLRNSSGTVIDSVGYGTGTSNAYVEGAPAAAPAGGSSIGRHPNGYDSDHNDADFTVSTTPTPRAANP